MTLIGSKPRAICSRTRHTLGPRSKNLLSATIVLFVHTAGFLVVFFLSNDLDRRTGLDQGNRLYTRTPTDIHTTKHFVFLALFSFSNSPILLHVHTSASVPPAVEKWNTRWKTPLILFSLFFALGARVAGLGSVFCLLFLDYVSAAARSGRAADSAFMHQHLPRRVRAGEYCTTTCPAGRTRELGSVRRRGWGWAQKGGVRRVGQWRVAKHTYDGEDTSFGPGDS